ncbi:unnamed protein product [Didymodactylos carnosus]|uniref:G-protein coupled receptors family 1 profile domain-containing protein n=1 Tax=Didymodactylos carnosus TaxID=1234261 RepID=A0A8S2GM42_9BILA|nr:unnamed protein product [Didymodactylos carnosus]CAF3534748.1 unnamed protein product [Didymodactylos carnosus]
MNSILSNFNFYTALTLIVLILSINLFHLWYLIFKRFQHNLNNGRLLTLSKSNLFSSSIASLFISFWLIPFFFTQTSVTNIWTPISYTWRLWLYGFHVIDSVQILSLLLLTIELYFIQKTSSNKISIRLYQPILFVIIIWLTPIIAFSPILWLSERNSLIIKRLNKQQLSTTSQLSDYFPFSLFQRYTYSPVLALLYVTTYIIPLCLSLLISLLSIVTYIRQKKMNHNKKNISKYKTNQILFDNNVKSHHCEIVELNSLIQNVLNFNLTDKRPITTSTFENYSNDHFTIGKKRDQCVNNFHTETTWSPSNQHIKEEHEELHNHRTKKIRTSSYEASLRSSIIIDDVVSVTLTNSSNSSDIMNRTSSMTEEELSSSLIVDSETLLIPSQTKNQIIKSISSRIVKNLILINILSVIVYFPYVISALLLTHYVIKIQSYLIIYSIYFHWFAALLTPLLHLYLQYFLFTWYCKKKIVNKHIPVYMIKNRMNEKQSMSRKKQKYTKFTNERIKYYTDCRKNSEFSSMNKLTWMPSTIECFKLRKSTA